MRKKWLAIKTPKDVRKLSGAWSEFGQEVVRQDYSGDVVLIIKPFPIPKSYIQPKELDSKAPRISPVIGHLTTLTPTD